MLLNLSKDPLTGMYTGTFYDGPDGIDEFAVSGNTLGECFERIIAFQAVNALDYLPD